ncbi:MAG TPA: hypothetical protein VFZ77_07150 [Acidimicrobiales bacterium]
MAFIEFLDRNVDLLLAADRGAPADRRRSRSSPGRSRPVSRRRRPRR